MKQLTQNLKNGKLGLMDVAYPSCQKGGIVVRTVNSVISPGTEKSVILMAKKSLVGKARARPDLLKRALEKAKKEGLINIFLESMNRLDDLFPLGYSASGVVVEIGKDIQDFRVGEKVAIAGSGFASHSEYNFVPQNLAFKLPKRKDNQDIDFEESAFCMLGAISLHGIREAQVKPGDYVAVIGLGLLGLLTVQILKALGCKPVGIDIDESKLEMAKSLGCQYVINADSAARGFIDSLTGKAGVSSVIITAAADDNKPVSLAEKITAVKATIILVGVCDIHLERKYFWDKELIFKVSKSAGNPDEERKNIQEFLSLISEDKINVKGLITHRFAFRDSVSAYKMLLGGKSFYIGVILEYDGKQPMVATKDGSSGINLNIRKISPKNVDKRKKIGFIGGGMFTKNILLPNLSKVKGVDLVGIATTRGITAGHLASKYRFSYSTTDYTRLLEDDSIGSIFITTRHSLHKKFIIEALKRNKDIFVEKPLCLNRQELEEISAAFKASNSLLMVGFNRRYSLLARDMKDFFDNQEPFVINYRVNAGFIELSHWVQNPKEGGGRIIGEACHFVDFMQFITSSYPVKVFTEGISNSRVFIPGDNIISVLKFNDGSTASITYTSKGSKLYPKEIIEVYQRGSVYCLEDFRNVFKIKDSRKKRLRLASQDLGYRQELEYFFSQDLSRGAFNDYRKNSLAIFAMQESLDTGSPVQLEDKSL